MGEIVVNVAWLMASLYVALVLWRLADELLKNRAPALSHAIEFAIGKE